jgi:hypothetical protein
MTLDDVLRIREGWKGDTGVAARDVRLLSDEIIRLHGEISRDNMFTSSLLADVERLKTIIEAGATHEKE